MIDQDPELLYLNALYPEQPVHEMRPEDTALLVIDVQEFLARPDGKTGKRLLDAGLVDLHRDYFARVDAAIRNMGRLLSVARRSGIEVIHIAIKSLTDDARECANVHRTLKIRLPKDDPGNRIMPGVTPLPGEIVLYKITGSAFNSTPLHLILQNMRRRTLILCGLITNGCVESTARDARDLSYDLIVASDACAGYADETHRRTICRMARMNGNTCTVSEIEARVGRHLEGSTGLEIPLHGPTQRLSDSSAIIGKTTT